MFKEKIKKFIRLLTRWGIICIALLVFPRIITAITGSAWIRTPEKVEPQSVAIVFGAGLRRDGRPAAVLRDRVDRAVELYFSGKVDIC